MIDARPGDAAGWLAGDEVPTHALAFLDTNDPASSHRLLRHLKGGAGATRVVVASPGGAEWIGCELDADDVVEYPLAKTSVVGAVRTLLPVDDDAPRSEALIADASDQMATVDAAVSAMADIVRDTRSTTAVLRAMSRIAAESFTLSDVADITAAAAADSLGGQACALLLPDGDRWRVSGSFGLRPTETRLTLESDHWLVRDLMQSRRGAIIDNSDVARARLVNAPLASYDQLLVASELGTQALLMLGRREEAFTEDDLDGARAVLDEASAPVAEALAIRRLSRDLLRFIDIPDY